MAQLWIIYASRHDRPMFQGRSIGDSLDEISFYFSPILLAVVGPVLAKWLHWRGSGWAWPAAGVPCAVLLLGLGLAVFLTFNPISFGHR